MTSAPKYCTCKTFPEACVFHPPAPRVLPETYEPLEPYCCECGQMPAKLIFPDSYRRICGVCWHRYRVARAVADMVKAARRGAA